MKVTVTREKGGDGWHYCRYLIDRIEFPRSIDSPHEILLSEAYAVHARMSMETDLDDIARVIARELERHPCIGENLAWVLAQAVRVIKYGTVHRVVMEARVGGE